AISLYCFSRRAFLCDEYARRVLSDRGAAVPASYRSFRRALDPALARTSLTVAELAVLHGLIVAEGKLRARWTHRRPAAEHDEPSGRTSGDQVPQPGRRTARIGA